MKVLDKKSWDFVCSQVGMDGDFTYDVYISGSVAGFQYTYADDKMVCIYMADDKIPMIHIGLLYVKEKHRNKGLATNFINKLKEQSPCISLSIQKEGHQEMRDLVEKLGFKKTRFVIAGQDLSQPDCDYYEFVASPR